ncbi:hypothetical protein FD12_GL002414 [Lentilactobacillus rapi DSM 19907 = JCM 15042]|uniref:Uncharacterized protein n=2 Tax=Lentilactobacillus rapi TaxID=481723 RepID=A0A512PMV2_9LACO|nr:hypothetical protein FD12_GL002414 [Lentilactobacillus rapi DSM 19907 = JCM 15042]GEP72521.1 hypothetical protein LRA02_13890 [Lentilactobacillus rapi]
MEVSARRNCPNISKCGTIVLKTRSADIEIAWSSSLCWYDVNIFSEFKNITFHWVIGGFAITLWKRAQSN